MLNQKVSAALLIVFTFISGFPSPARSDTVECPQSIAKHQGRYEAVLSVSDTVHNGGLYIRLAILNHSGREELYFRIANLFSHLTFTNAMGKVVFPINTSPAMFSGSFESMPETCDFIATSIDARSLPPGNYFVRADVTMREQSQAYGEGYEIQSDRVPFTIP
jgi:hypothetical protein